jgi:uncharacterized membrane protein YeaQ/YmgE (transglycosylase-associated protein family)
MGPFAFIVIGWVTGMIARVIIPNARRMGFISMLLVGMVGAIFGGMFAGNFNTEGPMFAVRTPSIIGAFVGASAAIFVVTALSRRRVHA